MADLVHATLTEDEDVLLGALDPQGTDRVLAICARGNGDAALALLARGPAAVTVTDWFDRGGLCAQLDFKLAMIAAWDATKIRKFLALDRGMTDSEREALFGELVVKLSAEAQSFWRERREAVKTGLVVADETRQWGRRLARLLPILRALRAFPSLRDGLLKFGLSLAGLFFPKEERQHSLGYRQLMEDPATALDSLAERAGAAPGGDFVQASRFAYLSAAGLAKLKDHAPRLSVVARDAIPSGCSRFYVSNLIDYLEANEFDMLLQTLISGAAPNWRLLMNSTYRSNMQHPHVMNVLGKKLAKVDRDLTAQLRAKDRLGVYPGLTVLTAP